MKRILGFVLVVFFVCSCSLSRILYKNNFRHDSKMKVGYYTPQMFGAKADGRTDDTDAIQKATNTISKNGGGVLFFPEGTYLIETFNVAAKDFGYGAIDMHSNVHYLGDGKAIIKVADNVNRNNFSWQGVFIGRYGENTTNVTFENLIFDLNGSNNIYPYYKDFKNNSCCSAIRTGYPVNIKILGCTIIECPGLNCLALGYAKGAVIKDNKFLNSADAINGNKVHDHSCILVAGNDVVVENNHLINDNLSMVGTAIEINSVGAVVRNNYAKNFRVGCLVSPVGITSVKDVVISDNTFEDNFMALQIWSGEEGTETKNVSFIRNNIIPHTTCTNGYYAIDMRTYAKSPIVGVRIEGNEISMPAVSNEVYYGGIITGKHTTNIEVTNNEFRNLTGSAIAAIEGASNIVIRGNLFKDCSISESSDANRVVLINPGNAVSRNVTITSNKFVNSSKKSLRGIWLINDCQSCSLNKNTFEGFEPYNEIDGALLKGKAAVKIVK